VGIKETSGHYTENLHRSLMVPRSRGTSASAKKVIKVKKDEATMSKRVEILRESNTLFRKSIMRSGNISTNTPNRGPRREAKRATGWQVVSRSDGKISPSRKITTKQRHAKKKNSAKRLNAPLVKNEKKTKPICLELL